MALGAATVSALLAAGAVAAILSCLGEPAVHSVVRGAVISGVIVFCHIALRQRN